MNTIKQILVFYMTVLFELILEGKCRPSTWNFYRFCLMQTIKGFNGKFIEMHAQYICFINFCSVTSAFNNIDFYNQTYQRFSLILKRWLIFLAVTTFTKNNNRRYRKLLPVYLFVVRIGTDAASAVVESRSVLRQYCERCAGRVNKCTHTGQI